jgi:hypothetical protein
METMTQPPPFLKRKHSDTQEIVPYVAEEEGSGPQLPSQPVVNTLEIEWFLMRLDDVALLMVKWHDLTWYMVVTV